MTNLSTGMDGEPVRVMLVDEHPVFREGLRSIIESLPNHVVTAEAESVSETLSVFTTAAPHLILVDIQLQDGTAAELIDALHQQEPELSVLVLADGNHSRDVLAATEAGAKGFLTRTAGKNEVRTAVTELAAGRSYIHPEITHILMDKVRHPPRPPVEAELLTGREKDILRLLVEGLQPKDIGSRLFLSISTVKTHMRALYRKLDVSSRTQLVVKAIRLGLVDE